MQIRLAENRVRVPTVISSCMLRWKQSERSLRTPPAPVTTGLFLLAALFVTVNYFVAASSRPVALVGSAIILLGIPAYLIQSRKAGRVGQRGGEQRGGHARRRLNPLPPQTLRAPSKSEAGER